MRMGRRDLSPAGKRPRAGARLQRDAQRRAVAASERRLRETFEHAGVGITRIDVDGRYVEVNRKFCETQLKVIVEEVETEAQLEFPERYGCDEVQGFLYSTPIPGDECGEMLADDGRFRKR
jgi:PAS domain-containing protein